MNFAVLQFPASNCDQDAVHVLKNVLGQSARLLWHNERSLGNTDAVIIPGGFSYGDYLRTGAIARFSPVMQAVQQFAANGGPVLGIRVMNLEEMAALVLRHGARALGRGPRLGAGVRQPVVQACVGLGDPRLGALAEPLRKGEGDLLADLSGIARSLKNILLRTEQGKGFLGALTSEDLDRVRVLVERLPRRARAGGLALAGFLCRGPLEEPWSASR